MAGTDCVYKAEISVYLQAKAGAYERVLRLPLATLQPSLDTSLRNPQTE